MNSQTILTIILMFVVFGVGFLAGRMTTPSPISIPTSQTDVSETPSNESGPETSTSQEGTTEDEADSSNVTLTAGQSKMLESLGINPDEVTVTPQMVACAETKLGATRIEEIKNGATPSFSEGVSLVACYK